VTQKLNALRVENDEVSAKHEDLQGKVKVLEQENLAKEHEITSLSHKNQLYESEVETLEKKNKEIQKALEEASGAGTHNESLQRRLQLLEEEAEESDKNIRETNEKYENTVLLQGNMLIDERSLGYAKQMSKPAITSARSKLLRPPVTNGKRSTKRWSRNMHRSRRN